MLSSSLPAANPRLPEHKIGIFVRIVGVFVRFAEGGEGGGVELSLCV